ncbi:hypothetical protein D9757_011080 [Collybiopsis confluens]|uniref:Cytochrome P450 n=1 Tax=Collybiopsis confluens TaxID=2823264 RepID=A0A8H5GQC6_9AGAR|nr:hypothetical protein D9757_011080 [Collybiopsis confluens]
MPFLFVSAWIGLAVLAPVCILYYCRRSTLPFPPGPRSPQMPILDAWVTYKEWGKKYGDLIYIREKNILITNSSEVVVDLFEKRSRIYSDRESSSAIRLCGADRIVSLQQYSNKWKQHRKFFEQHFRQSNSSRFYTAQYSKVRELLQNLATEPDNFGQHTMLFSQSLMFAILYGLDISHEDPLARKTVETVATLGQIFMTGFPVLENFPWLRFLPSFLPGCGFKKIANKVFQNLDEIDTIPFEAALQNLHTGKSTSLVAELAQRYEKMPAEIKMIKAMGTTSFIGASDTTMSAISSFLLTATLHPDTQVKARAEIDRIIGRDRLPTFDDRQHLPYVESVYREVMRLYPPVPLGVNHVSMENDIYRGCHIPKGCKIVPNIWLETHLCSLHFSSNNVIRAMNRDPSLYEDPDKFSPERHLNAPAGPFTNINNIHAFGFGRRICVGRYMADNTVWLAIASILATLVLSTAKDSEGKEIDIPGEFNNIFFLFVL